MFLNLGDFPMDGDGHGWPLLTEELMEDFEAELSEYAWGFAGVDHCS
jgi:hypothetical protein